MESLGRCGRSCEAPAYASGEKVAASRGGQGGGATTSTLRPVLGATGSRQAQAGVQTSAVSATPRPIYDSCLHTRAGAGAKGSETGSRPPGPLKCVWNQWPAGPGSAPASRSPLEEQLPHHKQEPEQRRPPSGRRASAPAASSTFGCQPAPAAVEPHLREPQAAARSRGCAGAGARGRSLPRQHPPLPSCDRSRRGVSGARTGGFCRPVRVGACDGRGGAPGGVAERRPCRRLALSRARRWATDGSSHI